MMYDELVKRLREPFQYENCVLCKEAADAIERLQYFNGFCQEAAKMAHENEPKWIPVTERLPEDFEPVYAALRSGGRENWVIEVEAYDPYLTCPWGHIPLIEMGKAHVYAWMPRPLPEPPKEK